MPTQEKKVLFATDMSRDCRDAYAYALDLSTRHQARLVLLHIIEQQPIDMNKKIKDLFGEERYEEILRENESKAKSTLIGKRKESDLINAALRAITQDASGDRAENPVADDKIVIKKGDVVEEIIATAMEEACELIMLSAHAESPQEAIVSKTIQDVLRRSKVPVIIVPPMMGMAAR